MSGILTEEDVQFYETNGYLVIPSFWNEDIVENLRNAINQKIGELDLASSQSIFSTNEQNRKTDDYFLNSGREIRFFWEENACVDGVFVRPKEESINKIGHGLHDLDANFERVSYDTRVGKISKQLGLQMPLAVQSMYIFKQSFIGGEVCAHQDGAFLYTVPQTCIGFWWALDNCTTSNGCLWAVPGSHQLGVHRRFRRRDPPNDGTEFVPVEKIEWDLTQAIPLEVAAGSLVILHHALVHYSEANVSCNARHAYSIHVVDGIPSVSYPSDNWLQRPKEFPFREIPSHDDVVII